LLPQIAGVQELVGQQPAKRHDNTWGLHHPVLCLNRWLPQLNSRVSGESIMLYRR
jgi:hypothetical protein